MHERIIDHITGTGDSIFIALCSLHGNEPSGEEAIRIVARTIREREIPFRGTFAGIVGNVRAHARGVRYIDEDLNRIWSETELDEARRFSPETSEQLERAELFQLFTELVRGVEKRNVFVLDLHSTSSESPPFIAGRGELASPRWEEAVDRLGLAELVQTSDAIQGTFFSYLSAAGYYALAVEGGSHYSPETVVMSASVLWSLLGSLGHIDEDVSEVEQSRMHLQSASRNVPPRVRIVSDHPIVSSDKFRMRPGYRNFQAITKGECIADSIHGEVRVSTDGYLLFPLYQAQGDTGFYIAEAAPLSRT